MELDEYFFYEKRKNDKFTQKQMAEDLKITRHQLSRIMRRHECPSIKVALRIEKYTNGQVSGWEMIKKFHEKKGKCSES